MLDPRDWSYDVDAIPPVGDLATEGNNTVTYYVLVGPGLDHAGQCRLADAVAPVSLSSVYPLDTLRGNPCGVGFVTRGCLSDESEERLLVVS